jgi:hypothetical protein
MRRRFTVPALIAAVLTFIVLTPNLALAQALPEPPHGLQQLPPPPPPPIKPYTPVSITPPPVFNDPSFIAFRKDLADIAQRKDRTALAKLIVTTGYFWLQNKDLADPGKPGIENLAKAIDLDAKDGSGWEVIAALAAEPSASEWPQHKGLICAPAPPGLDLSGINTLLQATETDFSEWGYPVENGVEVRADAKQNAPVIDKLGLYLVRVLPDSAPPDATGAPSFFHVALPNGKSGYVPMAAIASPQTDHMCYAKDASGWKIAGYIGGNQP